MGKEKSYRVRTADNLFITLAICVIICLSCVFLFFDKKEEYREYYQPKLRELKIETFAPNGDNHYRLVARDMETGKIYRKIIDLWGSEENCQNVVQYYQNKLDKNEVLKLDISDKDLNLNYNIKFQYRFHCWVFLIGMIAWLVFGIGTNVSICEVHENYEEYPSWKFIASLLAYPMLVGCFIVWCFLMAI